ncbi:MAG: low molecular weight phosphotyrosine protein phosphatase [Sterolibacteriaceae bacterium MAG5]|nr:low molecular weight phosphotyrosine protein phosphatase [Candidatus Nitricoxidireducens bremensis]
MIAKVGVLMVCMGNICRSPTAEGVLRAFLEREGMAQWVDVDSAGTHAYHIGKAPDPRTLQAAARRGYDLTSLRARQVNDFDFVRFDHILAMDRDNLALLMRACPVQHSHKLRLFLDYASACDEDEVPDPYYGDADGFEQVLDLVEAAAAGLIASLRHK